ncbi:D-glucuronate isomerase [Lutibacter oricola]|uniref:Uronate isomerase n=1 Tax=Lutibacter oricola TaxID=762486 RepID=A0A1H3E1R6_9FLAO|nr:glucuronate isomerase [Lutibacter oricola]SDX71869.1 D-glucuronate isomerase [Lutibacter oricola]
MNFTKNKTFINNNFLLETDTAIKLYHQFASKMPIIDYHNHLSAKQIAENEPMINITDAWLSGDHYKWRGMRANGVDEKFVTGNSTKEEKFEKWAETVPYTVGNPLFHWTHLELKRYFEIEDLLQPSTSKEIYEAANQILAKKTPANLLEDMNVEVVCTTDDPTDNLEYHQQIAKGNFNIKVLPTFRSDGLFLIESENFRSYIEKLEKSTAISISNFEDLLKAIDLRIEFFHNNGCRLSDYGVEGNLFVDDYNEEEVSTIFSKFLNNETLSDSDLGKYKSCILHYLARKYYTKGWTQQYHLGAIRNNNKRLQNLFGADAGCDSIGDVPIAKSLSKFLNQLDSEEKLAKTITYNLNPAYNEVLATMMGNFNTSEVPGKMQYGAAWWFLDQKNGIEKQLNTLSNLGLLSRSIGMLTDSRSFLSFPRHEYFRRILCNILGKQIERAELPNDINFFGKIVENICYNNAKNYFNF